MDELPLTPADHPSPRATAPAREAAPGQRMQAPLAARMRPAAREEILGQTALVGPGSPLEPALAGQGMASMILVGPPGSGKTTIAKLLASAQSAHLISLSAVSAGVSDIRNAVTEAVARQRVGQRTVLFLDEIHHFSRTQQDALLPHVESGLLTLIGATTENPSFQISGALLSRVQVHELEPLSAEELTRLVERALADPARGLGELRLAIKPEALQLLIARSGGDARTVLNALEQMALESAPGSEIDHQLVLRTLSTPTLRHDRAGDFHYQLLSAFIKSMRGSDPDAAVYWLARLLDAGEDPVVPARRMVILAAEDIGLAEPRALELAVAAHQAIRVVGMPEGRLPLAEAAIFLSLAPKSNRVYLAYGKAHADVVSHLQLPVPLHLRNAVTARDRNKGYGQNYQYAHDDPEGLVEHAHLPEELVGRSYYQPSEHGKEKIMGARLGQIMARRSPEGAHGDEDRGLEGVEPGGTPQ